MVQLDFGRYGARARGGVRSSLFPFGPTMISMAVELAGGRTIEVAMIGRRGAVGGIVSCGKAPAFARAACSPAGSRLRVPMEALEDAKRRSPFIANLFCRFSDYLLSQVMQSVGLQRLPFYPGTRGALAASRAGPYRRPDRAHPAGSRRAARRSAHHRQRGRAVAGAGRAHQHRTRRGPGHRP